MALCCPMPALGRIVAEVLAAVEWAMSPATGVPIKPVYLRLQPGRGDAAIGIAAKRRPASDRR